MSRAKICPKCGAIAEWDSYFGGTRCTRCDFVEKPKPTHGDRIRSKSDEELAAWIESIVYCRSCPFHGKQCVGEAFVSRASCKLHWMEWLREETDNG